LVHSTSRDGKLAMSGLVYVPYHLPRQAGSAAIVYVHGGPTSQTVNTFSRIIQYMAKRGDRVVAPNYRGSTGYGKEFQQANLFDMGGGDLQDVLAAADWIKQTGYVDPKKLILMGGSYGGYMTMMGVTKAPEVWAAGVPFVPFVNWFTEIENEDPVLQQIARSVRQARTKSVCMLPAGVGYQDMGGRVMRYATRCMEKTSAGEQRDIALTRRWMDAIGIDVAVMFPTPMLQLGLHPQVEVEVALARAYNRWLCEQILAKEKRIVSMPYLPFNDPDATYQEVQVFGDTKGVVGCMITAPRYKPVHDNAYMKT